MKRDSVIRVVPERVQFLNQAAFDAHPVSAFDEKKWPGFCRNFEYKYLTSEAFSGTKETVMRGYVRHATESEEASPASRLLALIDAWPSPVLPMLDQPCNASSLTMSVDIVHEDVGVADGEWVQYESRVRHSESGYATVGERVWSMEGELLAISQQNVVHFA
jgi:acyl-CoA thioesterase